MELPLFENTYIRDLKLNLGDAGFSIICPGLNIHPLKLKIIQNTFWHIMCFNLFLKSCKMDSCNMMGSTYSVGENRRYNGYLKGL